MNSLIKIILLGMMFFSLQGCSDKELRMFNKVLHDAQVKENRATQKRIAQCRQDYANGYRSDLNCY